MEMKSNHKNFVHLVGLYTYYRMMHGAYNVKYIHQSIKYWLLECLTLSCKYNLCVSKYSRSANSSGRAFKSLVVSIHRWSNLNDRTLIMSLQSDKFVFIKEMDSHVVSRLVLVPRMKCRFEVYINQNSQAADVNVILVSSLHVSHLYNTHALKLWAVFSYCNVFGQLITLAVERHKTFSTDSSSSSSSSCKLNYSTPRLVSLQLELLQLARSGESNMA